MVCTFFGHSDTPDSIYPVLEKTIAEVMEKYPGIKFYVGNKGRFDGLARHALKKLSAPYTVVLAYIPENPTKCCILTKTPSIPRVWKPYRNALPFPTETSGW